MARFLAIDWDGNELRVVDASISRGATHINKVLATTDNFTATLAEAETAGKLLRQRLKSAGISAAPVLYCVARERLIVKDIRFPVTAPHEEPALVRFQATKDLSESADEIVLDYTLLGPAGATGEQRALAFLLRRELLTVYKNMCKAAGLELAGVAPRALGVAGGVRATVTGGFPPEGAVAVLAIMPASAELCVTEGGRLLLSRSLPAGPTLPADVKRSLLVMAGQFPGRPVRSLVALDLGEHDERLSRLEHVLEIPVTRGEVLPANLRESLPTANRNQLAGAVGLLHAWSRDRRLEVNFLAPRQPRAPRSASRIRLLAGAGVAAALLFAVAWVCYSKLQEKDEVLQSLLAQKNSLDQQLLILEEDAKRIKALDDWASAEIVWLDELYDMTERFPDTNAIRLTTLTGEPLARVGKDKHTGRMSIKGITTQNFDAVNTLMERLDQEESFRRDAKHMSQNTSVDRFRFRQQFATKIEIEARPPTKYVRQLPEEDEEEEEGGRGRRRPQRDVGDFSFGGQP